MNASVKMLVQCAAVVKKTNSMLGIIREDTANKANNIDLWIAADRSMLRHHLEHCIQFGLPYLKADIELENMRMTATKIIKKLEHLFYKERLKSLGHFSSGGRGNKLRAHDRSV